MDNNLTSELHPAGTDLFSGFGSFIRDLSENDESMIAGGGGRHSKSSKSGKRHGRRRKNRDRDNKRSYSKKHC